MGKFEGLLLVNSLMHAGRVEVGKWFEGIIELMPRISLTLAKYHLKRGCPLFVHFRSRQLLQILLLQKSQGKR